MSHPKLPPLEKAGMWATISNAILAGWPATVRLIIVLVVIAALVCAILLLTHQATSPVGVLLDRLIPYIPAPKPG